MSHREQPTVIVTGGRGGIGSGIIGRLLQERWNVVSVDSGADLPPRAAGEPSADGVLEVRADVSSPAECAAVVARTLQAWGRLDALVNNAGIARQIPHGDLDAVSDEFWDRIMAVNLKGPWNMIKAARTALASAPGGQVVNIASIAGLIAGGSSVPYAVSKAGLIHLTRLLANALGPQIRVNAVAPGYVETPLTVSWEPLRQAVVANAPARRLGHPADVAEAVWGLLSMDYVTGAILTVDGGLSLA